MSNRLLLTGAYLASFVTDDDALKIDAGRDATAVAWSPDGTRLATGSFDPYVVNIWDIASILGKPSSAPVPITLVGHTASVWSIAWSPDGQQLLSGSTDGTARIWELASGTQLRTLRANIGRNSNATTWSTDGQFILTGGDDGVARIWVAGSQLMSAELTRRLCNLNFFNDSQIKDVKPDWRGCDVELKVITQ